MESETHTLQECVARRAESLLTGAGLDVDYLETEAGHWLPPEVVERAATLVERTVLKPSDLSA